ncbi:Uncharacterised protein [Mycobacterium tuberculosis]|nr:Uncharacterised protein [Mycobacterium tuberculosis]
MVQHRETHHGREVIIGQPGLGAIAADDARPLAVAAVQALDHRVVDFNGGERGGQAKERLQCRPITGADLQRPGAEFDVLQRPGQELIGHRFFPACRAAMTPM